MNAREDYELGGTFDAYEFEELESCDLDEVLRTEILPEIQHPEYGPFGSDWG